MSSLLCAGVFLDSGAHAWAAPAESAAEDGAVAVAEQKAALAFQAYQGKRYADAVRLYLEAYEAAPTADMLYNIARIYDAKLGDRPLAMNFYRRYIAEPGAAADRIQTANERLAHLREAELAAAQPVQSPRPAPALSVAPAAAPPAAAIVESGWSESEVIGAILMGSGAVALGVGAGFGFAAMNETQTVRDLCDGNVCREQRGVDAAESASNHATISTIGLASGGALLAVGGIIYFWLGGDSTERSTQISKQGTRLNAHVGTAGRSWSVELGGSW